MHLKNALSGNKKNSKFRQHQGDVSFKYYSDKFTSENSRGCKIFYKTFFFLFFNAEIYYLQLRYLSA